MDLQEHFDAVVHAFRRGRVVPFLGAGANLYGRPPGVPWKGAYLPSGAELSEFLADNLGFPRGVTSPTSALTRLPVSPDLIAERGDLTRVAQYITLRDGSGPLYDELHDLLDTDYPITPLHRFFARLPAALRMAGCRDCHQVIITTNYDDVLERAFSEEQEPFDLLTYVAEGRLCGKFLHRSPTGQTVVIHRPNKYLGASPTIRSVIIKIHGTVDRSDPAKDSYVVTEDHYIDFLAHADAANLFPVEVAAKLLNSHFLFLGYRLRDWNLRVILRRIWGNQKLSYKSWAVQKSPNFIDERSWTEKGVTIFPIALEEYIGDLDRHIANQLHRSHLL